MYTIGQIEEITGVKQHVLRYWEEVIPSFSPAKDISGRRIYSQRDLDLILRLRYLIYEKKFTIEGAQNQLVSESEYVMQNAEMMMTIQGIRKSLAEAFFTIRKYRRKKDEGNRKNI